MPLCRPRQAWMEEAKGMNWEVETMVTPSPMIVSFATYPYDTEHFIQFLDASDERAVPPEQRELLSSDNVALYHSRLWMNGLPHSLVWWCIFSFYKSNWGIFLCLEMEGLQSPIIQPDVLAGGNECCLHGNRFKGMPEMVDRSRMFFSWCIARKNINVDKNL